MAAGYKMALSCQDGRHGDPAKVRDTNCHHIANSIPNNCWTPKYYTKLAFMLKRNVRCDIVLVSVRCGSTIHQLPSRTTFEAILTPHMHSRAEHISSSHIYRRHQSSGNCGIIWILFSLFFWKNSVFGQNFESEIWKKLYISLQSSLRQIHWCITSKI